MRRRVDGAVRGRRRRRDPGARVRCAGDLGTGPRRVATLAHDGRGQCRRFRASRCRERCTADGRPARRRLGHPDPLGRPGGSRRHRRLRDGLSRRRRDRGRRALGSGARSFQPWGREPAGGRVSGRNEPILVVEGELIEPLTTQGPAARAGARLHARLAISPLLGVIAGGFVVEGLGWRWLFFAQFPFGVVALLFGVVVLRESKGDVTERFDVRGCVLSIVGFGALLLVFNRGPSGEWDWVSVPMIALGMLAVALLVAFVRHERRVTAPILPVHYFGRR